MATRTLEREQLLPVDRERAFEFFADARNLEAITPPLLRFRIAGAAPSPMVEGVLIEYRLRLHWVPFRWLTRIDLWEPPVRFVDSQVRGPFALWEHTHSFEPRGEEVLIRDRVRYRVGLGPLGELAHALLVERDLRRIFDYRGEALTRLLPSRSGRPTRRPAP